MRILCLHGAGSSGAMLETQMTNLRRELDPSCELIFVDGPFECERGPGMLTCHAVDVPVDNLCTGISAQQDGPFFSHTQGYSPAQMVQAVNHLEDVLETEGPVDGIFGFSQGAALTLSYIYKQQTTASPLPIKFACLFSTAMPCSTEVEMGNSTISKLRALEYDITGRATGNRGDLTSAEKEFVKALQ